MKAYLLDRRCETHLYLAFGEDCVSAAKVLAEQIGGSYEDFSVGGSWEVYFTAWPGRHAKDVPAVPAPLSPIDQVRQFGHDE